LQQVIKLELRMKNLELAVGFAGAAPAAFVITA
jgi:hypothetical protein